MPRPKIPKNLGPYVPPARPKVRRTNVKYTEEDKVFVLDLVSKGWTERKIEREHGIPRTTTGRWKRDPDMVLGTGRQGKVLTDDEEALIVLALEYLSASGLPLGRNHITTVVQEFVKEIGRPNPFRNGVPGYKFIIGFERRHKVGEIRLRNPEHLSATRALAMTKENVQRFYDKLKKVLEENDIFEHPQFLFNLDETNLTGASDSTKVYVGVAQRNAYQIIPDGTKTSFTVLFCGNAAGVFLPPLTIYKSERLYDLWTENGVAGASYSNSSSGWMLAKNFEGWMENIFVPYVKTNCGGHKVVLTYDGHNSHITYNTTRMAMDANITILCLPPHTSHALQPLDVGVFKSVKQNWRTIVRDHFNLTKRKLCKDTFPPLLKKLWATLKGENLVAGFRAAGLYPFNSEAVNNKIIIGDTDLVANVVTSRPKMTKRSTQKILVNKLEKAVSGHIDHIMAVLHPPVATRTRKRVQGVSGEVLTAEESRLRLQRDEAEKKLKDDKKEQNKAIRAKKAAEKLLDISIKPVAKKKKDNSGQPVPSGTGIQRYLTPSVTTASVHNEQDPSSLPGPSGTQDLSLLCPSDDEDLIEIEIANQLLLAQTNQNNDVEGSGFYAEQSTMDSDVDDPASAVLPRPTATQCKRKIKPLKTHVIYEYEGANFPGLVKKYDKKLGKVEIQRFNKGDRLTSWKWPVDEVLHTCNVRDIVEILDTKPRLICGRTSEYFIERMKVHGW